MHLPAAAKGFLVTAEHMAIPLAGGRWPTLSSLLRATVARSRSYARPPASLGAHTELPHRRRPLEWPPWWEAKMRASGDGGGMPLWWPCPRRWPTPPWPLIIYHEARLWPARERLRRAQSVAAKILRAPPHHPPHIGGRAPDLAPLKPLQGAGGGFNGSRELYSVSIAHAELLLPRGSPPAPPPCPPPHPSAPPPPNSLPPNLAP